MVFADTRRRRRGAAEKQRQTKAAQQA